MSSNNTITDNSTIPASQIVTPYTHYGYVPTLWICVTFVVVFSVSTVVHLGQALFVKPRLWWLLPTTVMCGVGEIIGWSARFWSNRNPENNNAFLMQITTTIIAPVFLTAALYTILGVIIGMIGHQYSRLKPKTYLKIFVTSDILALVIQAVGGAIASGATTDAASNNGAHIMLGGIFIQMIAMLCYTALAAEFLLRVYYRKPFGQGYQEPTPDSNDKTWQSERGYLPFRISLMVLGLAIATVFVFIRTIYRTIELLGGWHGHIIRTQVFFAVLDGTPIAVALISLNILSPVYLLRPERAGSLA